MFTGIKKRIMIRNIEKRQAVGYNITADELYELPADAGQDINNSYFFTATGTDGESMYIRLGLRGDGSREAWFGYRDRAHNLFIANNAELFEGESECPLKVSCAEPGSLWDIEYNGEAKDVSGAAHSVSFKGRFSARGRIFDFFYDNDPATTAASIAAEKWNKKLFEDIGRNNQRHYEQQGIIEGSLLIDGEARSISIMCARDHSYGKRDWSYMNMHVWLLAVDEKGNCLNISMVSYPAVKEIWTGYTNMRTGEPESFKSVENKSDLVSEGQSGGEINIICTLTDGSKLDVRTRREVYKTYHFNNGEYIFHEGMGEININGKSVFGCIEFSFNADSSRWNRY